MKIILTLVLTIILFLLGISIVILNPLNAMAISFGMLLVAVAILNMAVHVYFPQQPQGTVELKVINVRTEKKPVKKAKKAKKKVSRARKKRKG